MVDNWKRGVASLVERCVDRGEEVVWWSLLAPSAEFAVSGELDAEADAGADAGAGAGAGGCTQVEDDDVHWWRVFTGAGDLVNEKIGG